MRSLFIVLGFSLGIIACQSNTDSVAPAEINKPKVVKESLASAPASYMQLLQAKANGIEATMYSSGASFSVFEKQSVLAFLQLISTAAPQSLSTNQIGHIMFLQDGKKILLANIYDNGSDVYMKIEDDINDATYYNVLKGQARDMFLNVKVQSTP